MCSSDLDGDAVFDPGVASRLWCMDPGVRSTDEIDGSCSSGPSPEYDTIDFESCLTSAFAEVRSGVGWALQPSAYARRQASFALRARSDAAHQRHRTLTPSFLGLELVWLERDCAKIVIARFQSELDVPLLPAVGFAIDGDFIELVLGFVPKLECQLNSCWKFFNLDLTLLVADSDIRMVGNDVISSHPRMDIAFDFGGTTF